MTEITKEQRAAVEWLDHIAGHSTLTTDRDSAVVLLALLPPELTSPIPRLPTEPGYYLDNAGDVWKLTGHQWHLGSNFVGAARARNFAPFTRLVPQRPQITREQLDEAYLNAEYGNGMNAVLALVNGADQ